MSEFNSSNIYKIAVVMGSDSDLKTLKPATDILNEFGIETEVCILSAHRTPMEMMEYAKKAESENIKVIIAGAGGAAHLPGMIASLTCIPVIGVPVESKTLRGIDSLLSIISGGDCPCQPEFGLQLLQALLSDKNIVLPLRS